MNQIQPTARRTQLRVAGASILAAIGVCATLLRPLAAASKNADEQSVPLTGQWAIDPGESRDQVRFTLKASGRGFSMSWSSSGTPVRKLEGLDPEAGSRGSSQVEFRLRREAGSFVCRGVIENGSGGGIFTLELDPAFGGELERRGVGRPSLAEQAKLAYADAGFDLLDELKKQGFETPTLETFSRMVQHGVSLGYVRSMGMLGYHFGSIAQLVTARDHGVDPVYVGALRAAGYRDLTFDQLLRARDHGVDLNYVAAMGRAGFHEVPLDDLIRARDHGVDESFVRRVQDGRRDRLSLDEVIRLRDRGY